MSTTGDRIAVRPGSGCGAASAGCSRAQTGDGVAAAAAQRRAGRADPGHPAAAAVLLQPAAAVLARTARRIDFVVPSIIALAVMSAAFTGLAIGTGFERKYARAQAARRDRAAPLGAASRGKTLGRADPGGCPDRADLRARASRSGWHPHGDPLSAGPADRARHGRVRRAGAAGRRHAAGRGHPRGGQPDLAGAAVRRRHRDPAGQVPARDCADVLRYLPSAALSDGLHRVLQDGGAAGPRSGDAAGLGRVALPAAARWFRWE